MGSFVFKSFSSLLSWVTRGARVSFGDEGAFEWVLYVWKIGS